MLKKNKSKINYGRAILASVADIFCSHHEKLSKRSKEEQLLIGAHFTILEQEIKTEIKSMLKNHKPKNQKK